MNRRPAPLASTLTLLLASLAGCAPAATRTYSVELTNRTDRPLTVWPVKEGGPFEAGWASPEEVALASPDLPQGVTPVTVAAGRTLEAGPLVGRFAAGSRAVLRVYDGARTLPQLLASGRGSPGRSDPVLREGANRLVAERSPDGLTVRAAP